MKKNHYINSKVNHNILSELGFFVLKNAFKKELDYNTNLDLDLSMYTVFASVTNYLSRRVEQSASKASEEVKFERASKKLSFFDNIA